MLHPSVSTSSSCSFLRSDGYTTSRASAFFLPLFIRIFTRRRLILFSQLSIRVFSIVRSYSSMFTHRMTVFVIRNQRHRMCSALRLHPHSLKITGTYPQQYWVLKPCSTLRRPLARTFDPAEASNSGLGVLVCRGRLADGSNYHWEHERGVEVLADVMEPEPLLPSTHV
jgi:hypothetical protein